MKHLFYLFLISLISATAEYFYFSQKLFFQRRQLISLTSENTVLKNKINKQKNMLTSLNLKYSQTNYKYGFAMDHTSIFILPTDEAPVIHKCSKSIKVTIFYEVEVISEKWYEVGIDIDNTLLKGFLKERDIKFIVEESS